jgi:cation:H+ antiporter
MQAVNSLMTWLESFGQWSPWLFLALFLAGSFLMIWRLEAMSGDGMEGTVLGTLIMPYCSGMGNLIFALVLARHGGSGAEVMINCLVNNVTNMTLLIGLPALIWGLNIVPAKAPRPGKSGKGKADGNGKASPAQRINRLSLLLTLTAVLFFSGAGWVLGRDGKIDANDGLVLIGLFFFWQVIHVFDVLKNNVRQNKSLGWMLPVNLALLLVGAYAVYLSTDWLVNWLGHIHTGFVSARNLGWLSGWLMVVPNGLLAFYYAWRKQPEVVYTSQVGDGHICIPFCIGIFALYQPMVVPHFFELGLLLLVGATAVHFFFVSLFGRLPRFIGLLLCAAYGYFLWKGLR